MNQPVWSPEAEHDLDELTGFYAEIDPDLALMLLDRVNRAAARLVDHPRLGSALPDSDIRKWRATRTPFVILYRPIADGIRVLRLRDARSNWRG